MLVNVWPTIDTLPEPTAAGAWSLGLQPVAAGRAENRPWSVVPLAARAGFGTPAGTVVRDQVNAGCTARALPNWSRPWAANNWLFPLTVTVEPETAWPLAVLRLMLVSVGATTTATVALTGRRWRRPPSPPPCSCRPW